MIQNPRPDLLGAPKELPSGDEIAFLHAKFNREIRWMAHMFWQLLDELDRDDELSEQRELEQYDTGFEAGMQHGMDRADHEGDY